nr:iron-containing redox enzyme family protein [uncultured Noviherbaspirillum sp.]
MLNQPTRANDQIHYLQPHPVAPSSPLRRLYRALMRDEPSAQALDSADAYLREQLLATEALESDLPADIDDISDWIVHNTAVVGEQYRDYLQSRKEGGARRYFSSKSHALYFLKAVAPTKLVDGAWLYGLVPHWNDARFTALIRIYLEELGDGVPDKNHVLLFKRLLATHGCERWENLSEDHYVQGVLQLALARHAGNFLPEVIGFNLGYEQLPLHLLICAYELNELGIDPTYFTLHVTVDNADSGHARKALEGLVETMPRIGDRASFMARVARGYKLNMLGAGTNSVIEEFDIDREVIALFAEKSAVGKEAHSDYCRIGGRAINDWLSDPAQIPAFLDALVERDWIRRGQDPQNSRFWRLLQGERAEMFGVFSAYEQQVIYDWIADGWEGAQRRQISFRARQRLMDTLGASTPAEWHGVRGVLRNPSQRSASENQTDFNLELRTLEETLASLESRDEAMRLLTQLMSPASHHSPAGLMATRIYSRMLG